MNQNGPIVEIHRASCRLMEGRGAFKMVLTVRINGVEIRKCRYVDTEDGRRPWVSPPIETWMDENGRKRYNPLCVFPQEGRATLTEQAGHIYRMISREISSNE